MEIDSAALLFDIVESSRLVESFVEGVDFENYSESDLVRSAVERQFINIGEALNRLNIPIN